MGETCPRCGGYVQVRKDVDVVCLNCGWSGPTARGTGVRSKARPVGYEQSVAAHEAMRRSERRRRRVRKVS